MPKKLPLTTSPKQYREKVRAYSVFLKTDQDMCGEDVLTLIRFKLERVRSLVDARKLDSDAPRYVEQMSKAIDALKRIEADGYTAAELKKLKKRFGPSTKNESARKAAQRSETFQRLAAENAAMKQADLRIVLKIFERHLLEWWG